ncbi:MAG: hypothetical protein WKG07_30840 [Hymenobacter sp.]
MQLLAFRRPAFQLYLQAGGGVLLYRPRCLPGAARGPTVRRPTSLPSRNQLPRRGPAGPARRRLQRPPRRPAPRRPRSRLLLHLHRPRSTT